MYSLMNSTQISSLLCRWWLAVSEVWNKTNTSWDRKPLMMKCSSHRNNWMEEDTVNYDMVENTLDNERGRLAESHLAPMHVNRQRRTHKQNHTERDTTAYTQICYLMQATLICQMENFWSNFQNNRHKYCSPHYISDLFFLISSWLSNVCIISVHMRIYRCCIKYVIVHVLN